MKELSLERMEDCRGGDCPKSGNKVFAVMGAVAMVGGIVALGAATGGLAWGVGSAMAWTFGMPSTLYGLGCAFS